MGRPKKVDPEKKTKSVLEPRIDAATKQMDVGGHLIPATNTLTACLWGFANHPNPKAKEFYFWRCADILWNRDDLPDPLFDRHEWSERVIHESINNKYLAVGGAASSSKSHTLAGYGIISFLAAPSRTLVLMTSTSLREARKRIWGSVIKLLSVIEGAPVAIRDSIGAANYLDDRGVIYNTSGLTLIAAEKSRTREAVGKFIGLKQGRVILIGDELGELSPAITEAALSNLSKNPTFEYKGLSNPASRFDAFGDWATPKDGWDAVNVETDDEWDTKWGGKYIRLDGERSPNILAGQTLYDYLPTQAKIDEDRNLLGQNSRAYYRMVRAVFFDSDESEGIYGESELVSSGAMQKADFQNSPTKLLGIDPAFTNGGDRTMLHELLIGMHTNGQYVVEFGESFPINDDATNKAVPRNYQIVHAIIAHCKERGIRPEDVAVDATGAGSPFCDILAGEWSNEFLRVGFGGKASDKRVSLNSHLTGEELYANRVTELWMVGKEFIRTKQIYGISADLAKEMCVRRYELIKGASLRVRAETKTELKQRVGYSPDIADAAFIGLELARQRHGFVAIDMPKDKEGILKFNRQMTMGDLDVVSRSEHSSL